ncbi:DNA-binding response regulator [Rhizobium grahamii]|uniref:DNA-binding response regulator n=1 Tax=Rhizobium grahamii TaxID=1120045 RepID=A0A370KEW6_9HYPH|nr:DNA-binding response regulator [Rhizobium grahamii]
MELRVERGRLTAYDVSVRESLEGLIHSCGWRAETHGCAASFLARPRPDVPTCLILDLKLPDLCGLDLQGMICGKCDATPIIFITGVDDVTAAVCAMKAGAREYLLKPLPDDRLLLAIEDCIELSRNQLARRLELSTMSERYQLLSPRERQVMSLVCAGWLNKQVAFELGISEITVKAHRGQMMRKMNAHSVPELVVTAARLGILDTGPLVSLSDLH